MSKHDEVGEEKYFEKFIIRFKRIQRVGVSKSDIHNKDYRGVTHIIEYPNATGVWVRNDG